jgi:hypothetical protein
MPTAVPFRSQYAIAVERLSWLDTARFAVLLLRVRWLNRSLEAAHQRVERDGLDAAGATLVLTARRWMAAHEAVNVLLGTPELPEVGQLRAMMRRPAALDR